MPFKHSLNENKLKFLNLLCTNGTLAHEVKFDSDMLITHYTLFCQCNKVLTAGLQLLLYIWHGLTSLQNTVKMLRLYKIKRVQVRTWAVAGNYQVAPYHSFMGSCALINNYKKFRLIFMNNKMFPRRPETWGQNAPKVKITLRRSRKHCQFSRENALCGRGILHYRTTLVAVV